MEDWVQSDSREDPADHVSLTQDEEVASRVQELMEGDLPLEGRADPTSLAHREAETERERDEARDWRAKRCSWLRLSSS